MSAQVTPIIISEDDDQLSLTDTVLYYIDKSASMDLEDVSKITDWQPSSNNSLNFGYSTNAHWLKFSLQAAPGVTLLKHLLVFEYAVLDSISIYYYADPIGWNEVETGDHYPYSKRAYKYRYFVVPFRLSSNYPTDFYVRMRTESSAQIPMRLWTETAFVQHINKENYILGIYYGIILVMLLYNLFLYFSVREKSYLLYLCFILFFGLFQATINGFTYEYLWGDSIWWANNSVILFAAAFSFFIPTFANSFLNTREIAPTFFKILRVMSWLALINVIGALILPYSSVIKSTVFIALVTVMITVITAFVCLFRGYRPARFFLFAWLGLLTGGFLYGLKGFGLLPNNFFTEYGVQIGSASEVILLSLALADRINVLKREKAEIQEKAMAQLEVLVQERTTQVVHQKEIIESKNKDILDSILYAKRIQEAILPPAKYIKKFIPENFVVYKPKDIVAGDFYWMHINENEEDNSISQVLIAACDCTGHGVPGALVSVVCHDALNRAVREFRLTKPSDILNKTREIVITQFEKSEKDVKDGMDISLCSIDFKNGKLEYSGANNPFLLIRNSEPTEIKADVQPIGKFIRMNPFTNHCVDIQKNDNVYLFTDGFGDQFGGPNGKKYKSARLKELLRKISGLPVADQRKNLLNEFENWRGEIEQIDDVCIIGLRV